MELRDYQQRAVASMQGTDDALLVAPTGAGKTIMLRAIIGDKKALWIAHRDELCAQAPKTGNIDVRSIQGLLASGERPYASMLVFDEAHHYAADQWRALRASYSGARCVGATATPERGDGRALGDLFSRIVVAAQPRELIDAGYLMRAEVWSAPQRKGIACDPIEAYLKHGEGQAFVYAQSVDMARDLAVRWPGGAACIDFDTPAAERAQSMDLFRLGKLAALTCVYTLTEGVDVPQAQTAVVARSVGHHGMWLQIAGRVLRTAPGKTRAVVIDLAGAAERFGLPDDDREYSLDGKAIQKSRLDEPGLAVRVCLECGFTHRAIDATADGGCPRCGFVPPKPKRTAPRIYSDELRQVYSGASTPWAAKEEEFQRLVSLCVTRGWPVDWAAKKYKTLFPGEFPALCWYPAWTLDAVLRSYYAEGKARGFKPGYALARYRSTFGAWPNQR